MPARKAILNVGQERTLLDNLLLNLLMRTGLVTATPKEQLIINLLHANLVLAVKKYLQNKEDSTITTPQEKQKFITTCQSHINTALEKFANNLGWINYLKNIMKELANAVIRLTNHWLGTKYHFFSPVFGPSPYATEIKQLKDNLDNAVFLDGVEEPIVSNTL